MGTPQEKVVSIRASKEVSVGRWYKGFKNDNTPINKQGHYKVRLFKFNKSKTMFIAIHYITLIAIIF